MAYNHTHKEKPVTDPPPKGGKSQTQQKSFLQKVRELFKRK